MTANQIKAIIKRAKARRDADAAAEKKAHAGKLSAGRVIARYQKKLNALKRRPTVMYDSVTLSAIPKTAPAVAGYVRGRFLTFPKLTALFPLSRRVSIAVASTQNADVLDIEPGNSRPELAPGWVKRQQARGLKRPVVYASLSQMPDVLRALARAGIGRGSVRVWSAHYTHVAHICSPKTCGASFTADATQFTDKALGRNLDQSLVNPETFWD